MLLLIKAIFEGNDALKPLIIPVLGSLVYKITNEICFFLLV